MLLKLIPGKQEPAIHFSLSFADLPPTLPSPLSWTAQLSHLMHEDLEVPATLHSFDRAACIPSLLEEVAVDVEAKEIKCRFVDGSTEHIAFGLRGARNEEMLMDALRSIVNNVKESTMEDERVMRQRELEKHRTRSASVTTPTLLPPVRAGRQAKHKKQRSLFMHIVSSLSSMINLASPSSPSHPTLPFYSRPNSTGYRNSTSIIPSAITSDVAGLPSPTPIPGSSLRARALRRAARSALVDTFRRFILGELVRRFYAGPNAITDMREGEEYPYVYGLENHHQRERGGFCVWILHSMRRRALNRMDQIMEEAGPPSPEVTRIMRFSEEVLPGFCPTTMEVPLSFSDEEDEEPLVESPVSIVSETGSRIRSSLPAELYGMDVDVDDGQSILQRPQDYPPRPNVFPRRASSSASVSTDDSSESSSTERSSSSLSTVSTAPSSVESEPDYKEDNAIAPAPPPKDIPIILQSQYAVQSQRPKLHHLTPAARHEYTQLHHLRTRLDQLVQFAGSQSRVAADEVRSRLEVLEVRSRRRAWLNMALKGPMVKSGGIGGGSMIGLSTPFRSSPLARYMLTAEDLARRMSSISRGTYSSTSSLSSAYFRSVSSSVSSVSSSPSSSLSKASVAPFPSSRLRLRPKIDYGAALAAAIVEFVDSPAQATVSDSVVDDDGLTTTTMEPLVDDEEETLLDQDLEIYGDMLGPPRPRRHRRSMQDIILPTASASRASSASLLPVMEGSENDSKEFTLALSTRGRGRPRRQVSFMSSEDRNRRTFMGCDEVQVDQDDDQEEDYADQEDSEFDDGEADDTIPDLELGLTPVVVRSSIVEGVERPVVQSRVRTSSMMGALLRGAKGVQRSLSGSSKSQLQQIPTLGTDSILCQPIAADHPKPQPHAQLKMSTLPIPVPASNRRAMEIARPIIHTKMDVEMDDVEVNVQLRIDSFDYTAATPLVSVKSESSPVNAGAPSEFDLELQRHQAQEQEFTLAMDVPRGGGRRRRDFQYPVRHEAVRRPKLSHIFGEGQTSYNGSAC